MTDSPVFDDTMKELIGAFGENYETYDFADRPLNATMAAIKHAGNTGDWAAAHAKLTDVSYKLVGGNIRAEAITLIKLIEQEGYAETTNK